MLVRFGNGLGMAGEWPCYTRQRFARKISAMPEPKILEEVAAKISALLAASPAKDVEKNLRALLGGALSRFDLVTREEFDIQRELLVRACEKQAQLEARIAALEAKSGAKSAA